MADLTNVGVVPENYHGDLAAEVRGLIAEHAHGDPVLRDRLREFVLDLADAMSREVVVDVQAVRRGASE